MRTYELNPGTFAEIISVEMWLKAVKNGFFDESDGYALWVKDGQARNAYAFSTEPLDATHVAWYENDRKFRRIKKFTYLIVRILEIEDKILETNNPEEIKVLNELIKNSKKIYLDKPEMQKKALSQYPGLDIENNDYDKGRYLGYKQAIKDLLDLIK